MSSLRVESAFVDDALLDAVTRCLSALENDARAIDAGTASNGEKLRALVKHFGDNGLLRFVAPEAGHTVTSTALCLVRERLGYVSPLLDLAFAMQGLGVYPIVLGGGTQLKETWIQRVRRGDAVAAFALTEANAGSDVAGMETTIAEEGDAISINGTKTFISNAGVADFYCVFGVSGRVDGKTRLSCAVVPANAAGVQINTLDVLGAHPIGEVRLNKVRVPKENLLGSMGDGMRLALGTLERFRPTVGAAALGFATRALDESIAYTQGRVQFGKPLSEQQLVQSHLADMACDVESSRLLVYRAAATADAKKERHEIARTGSMAKLVATEAAQRVIDTAVQLHGGRGVLKETHVARLYEDIRALRIYEGASDIQKLLIAREVMKG